MFWKRKTRNARHRHDYVLDARMHQQQVRAGLMRFAARGLTGLLVVGVVLFALWRGGAFILDRLLYSNPSFAVQSVEVRTTGVLAPDTIRHWAGVKLGENLMALDLRRVKRDLELQPCVETASVERVLRGTLRIRIVEREPLAVIYEVRQRLGAPGFDTVPMFLDASGQVFPVPAGHMTTEPQARVVAQLPVLTGATGLELRVGRPVFAHNVQSALRLISLFDVSEMASATDIRQVDVSATEVLRVTTGQGSRVTFAMSLPPDMQLSRWRSIHELGLRNNKAIATLDLSITNHLPALWVEAGQVPAPSPKAAKPTRPRKKDV